MAATKKILGFDPDVNFPLDQDLVDHARGVLDRGREAHADWTKTFDAWAGAHAEQKALFDRLASRTLPDGWAKALPEFKADPKGVATRKASGEVLSALAKPLPELWGGSADLAGSNDTTMKGEPSFLPHDRESKMFPGNKYGRTLHFGIREHGMGAIMNGIALHGGTRLYGGTFLDVQRLHAGRGATGRADGTAGDLRLDPRLDRAGRRRTDPPADRAPVGAAGHPAPGRGPARGRQ